MSNPKTSEAKGPNRNEKIEEILVILGDLFQRLGYHQAAPGNVGITTPDYKFAGYRTYPNPESQPWARSYVANAPVNGWSNGYAQPHPPMVVNPEYFRF